MSVECRFVLVNNRISGLRCTTQVTAVDVVIYHSNGKDSLFERKYRTNPPPYQMSLSLVQDYSSEEEEERVAGDSDDNSHDGRDPSRLTAQVSRTYSECRKRSLLPSPEALFLEVTGPPEFLRKMNCRPLEHFQSAPSTSFASDNSNRLHKGTDLRRLYPVGSVVEAKAVLVDLGEPGCDDSENGIMKTPAGVPHDNIFPRPVGDADSTVITETDKRSRSKVKDKERSKRMKGQSSHATWKSETEMQLRQQFD